MKEGYKHTTIGKLPEDWEVVKLGTQLEKIIGGGTPSRDIPEYWNGNIPWATVKDLKTRIVNDTEEYISEKGLKQSASNFIPKYTLVIATRMALGKAVFFTKDVAINQDLKAIFPKKTLSKWYLFHWLIFQSGAIEKLGSGSTVKGIRLEVLNGLPISLPTLEQQQSIAVILSTVDEKIDVIDEQIAATTQLKQGLMQQLLTKGIGQTKFKSSPLGEIPESWEVVKLGEIYKKLSSGSTPSRRITEYYKGDILWITSGELNYNVITDTKEKITIDAVKDTNLKIHPPGTFFIAITGLEAAGTRGRCGINGIEATTNQSCMAFHANGRVDTNYLFHYYKGYGSNLAFDYAQGTKQQSFNGKILANILIKLPPVTEQKEIAEILSAVETKVEALKEKKVYYQELKQGLMQQLLTGKIRVNQTEPELATLDVAV